MENVENTQDTSVAASIREAQAALSSEIEATEEIDSNSHVEEVVETQGVSETQELDSSPPEVDTNLPPITPPASWDEENKSRFRELPREVQQYVAQRERERESQLGKVSSEAAKREQEYRDLDTVFEGKNQQYILNGTSKAQVVGQLLAAQDYLDSSPVEALNWLAQSYGYTFDDLAQLQSSGHQHANPEYAQLRQELAEVRGLMSERDQAIQSAQVDAMNQVINSFAGETGVDGSPLRPHFEQLRPQITAIASQLKQQNPHASPYDILNAAYEQATWMQPEIRSQLMNREWEKRTAQQQAQERLKVEQAKRAGSSVSGSPSGQATMSRAPKSVAESIAAARADLGA